ncbi:MAG: tetratricopeptide repeat protein [Kiritimatiellae bacterium]|nr:tetratricopeptide repeat protein [Kiritimatiellia bacterium]
MKRNTMKKHRSLIAALVVLLVGAISASAAVKGVIYKRDGTKFEGTIQWFGATQEYSVTRGGDGITLKISSAEVAKVVVPKPSGFDAAQKAVRGGSYAGAIRPLEQIVKNYERLGDWDIKAASLLATAYLGMNQYPQAKTMCEKIIRVNPDAARSGDLARVYWDVLEKMKLEAKLKSVLTDAIKSGGREVAAVAQMKRADIELSKGNVKKALVEGYLRTAILFRDVKDIQPEALLKSAKCFQQIGRQSEAEKMRKRLLEYFPQSPEAKQVRRGA